jgi:hypothetical protein
MPTTTTESLRRRHVRNPDPEGSRRWCGEAARRPVRRRAARARALAFATLAAFGFMAAAAPPSRGSDATACVAASAAVQRVARLPPRLLDAIGIVETGRIDPVRHVVAPWPWSVDANGEGHMYDSKAQAIAAVVQFQAAGIDSIDVGCMQINLHHHPDAFASLEEAFDPGANTAYAGRFLWRLFEQTGSWPQAAAAYHSQTPSLAQAYAARVMAAWPDAARYGATALPLAVFDPDSIYTPQFRARLRTDAALRASHEAAMRGRTYPAALPPLAARFRFAPLHPLHPQHALGWRDAAR